MGARKGLVRSAKGAGIRKSGAYKFFDITYCSKAIMARRSALRVRNGGHLSQQSYSFTSFQLGSGSYCVIAGASLPVFGPRFFW